VAIDAAVSGANSNSYVTLVEAEAYFAARLRGEAWTVASSADKEKALLTACRHIEAGRIRVHRRPYGYPGEPPDAMGRPWDPLALSNSDQALSFPRQRDKDNDGHYAIPKRVKDAQCEEALAMLARGAEQERRRALQAAGVTSFSVDGLSESYGAPTAALPLESAEARALLAPFIDKGGVIATSDYPDGEWSPGSAT
jgi:hypothetical protein